MCTLRHWPSAWTPSGIRGSQPTPTYTNRSTAISAAVSRSTRKGSCWIIQACSGGLAKLAIALRDVDQHNTYGHGTPEGRRHPVPLFGHPHSEPLAAPGHEPDLPDHKAQGQPDDRQSLAPVELQSQLVAALV